MKLKTFSKEPLEVKPLTLTVPDFTSNTLHKGSVSPDFLIVGDMQYDCFAPLPFYNSHLSFLNQFLSRTPWTVEKVSTTNVFDTFVDKGFYNKEEVERQKERLFARINELKPKFILFLGRDTFSAIKGKSSYFDDERGYPQHITINDTSYLCMFSMHPRDVFKQPKFRVVVQNDFAKAHRLYLNGWKQKSYSIKYWPSYYEAVAALEQIEKMDCLLSVDVETRGNFITCIGFAWNDREAFVLPFHTSNLKPMYSPLEEAVLWKKVCRIVESKNLLGQNACHFDSSIFSTYGINAKFEDDTMFLAWSIWQELPKTLGFLGSIYTDNPYHKDMLSDARSGRIDFKQEFYYCGLDCCVTYEIFNELKKELLTRPEGVYNHYKFNIKFSRVLEYCSRTGCNFDTPKRDARVLSLEEEAESRKNEICKELNRKDFNASSSKQVNTLLYEEWKLPPKIKIEEDEETGEEVERIKSGYLEILFLSKQFPNLPLLRKIGELRKLKHRISTLKAIRPLDGRVYWDFSTTGTETGRASGKKPKHGFGCQPQNVDKRDRDLFFAPDGWDFYKADLEGADSWTQAAQLCAVGDDRLMKDLLAGIKPAQVLALSIIYGTEVLTYTTEQLLALLAKGDLKTPEGKVKYGIAKAISHGSAYMMKEKTMSSNIFKQSDGELYVEPSDCAQWQKMFFLRYNFPAVHQNMRGILNTDGFSDGSSGLRRYFLGRRDDATLRAFLASGPQANTGRATNETMLNLFTHPLNLRSDGTSTLVLINQVHDEMDAIGRIEDRNLIHDLFESCSKIEQEVFGTKFVIPFAEDRGTRWDNCKEVKYA